MGLSILDKVKPLKDGSYSSLITDVEDRLGHDLRYAADISKIKNQVGWVPQCDFERGARQTFNCFSSKYIKVGTSTK